MKKENKQILIIVLNLLAIIGNIFSAFILLIIKFLAPYFNELEEMSANNQIGILSQMIIISVCIILSILNIIFSKDVNKNKEKILLCTTTSIMFGTIYNIIIGFINIIILLIKSKDEVKEEELPKLEKIEVKISERIMYAILFVGIFIVSYTSLVTNIIKDWNVWIKVIIIYLLQILCLTIPFRKNLKRDIKAFSLNKKRYFKEIAKTISLIIICYIPIAIILKLIIGESSNQEAIKDLPIWLTFILSIIIAPICEEIMFRGFLRKVLKNDIIFIIFSALIFGITHCLYIEENWIMYLHIIPYAILGAGFAKIYTKTDNIFTDMSVHFCWNMLAFISMILLKT